MDRLNFRSALNVAEKPSVAKAVTEILSRRNSRRLNSDSKFNPVSEFDYQINNDMYRMVFTSVRGHMMTYEFGLENKPWVLERIEDLYTADINKSTVEDCKLIEKNLKSYGRQVDTLILWLDCDREGENIAFEVVDIVRSVNPRVNILRAHFSALTERDIVRAVMNLEVPNKNLSDAVDIRQKIDLIIGASFTRLQTLSFRNLFYGANLENSSKDQKHVISYGPCQFPTLNFIVERTEKIRNFIPEEFYYIELMIKKKIDNKENEILFNWKRNRLFDKLITLSIYEKVHDAKKCRVVSTRSNPKTRLRPLPLNTVEMQKMVSKKLRINSHETMEICEKLYQKGFISYPRTETQKFGINQIPFLKKLVEEQQQSNVWGAYAEKLINEEGRYTLPRQGRLDDNAHPPIHPVKFADPSQLEEKPKKIYEFLVRHFLACVSPDAKGEETVSDLEMGREYFSTKGLVITDQGYLDVYPYDKWTDTYMPYFGEGEEFIPSKLLFQTGKTTPPSFLTEAELIGLMDKQGIGTDATIHEHIKHIQERGYAVQTGSLFKPTLIGTALIKSYETLGLEIYKPYLRAQMERDMKDVCEGRKHKDPVFNEMKREMKNIFDRVFNSISRMKEYILKFMADNKNYEQQLHISLSFNSSNRNNNRGNYNPGNGGGNNSNNRDNNRDNQGNDQGNDHGNGDNFGGGNDRGGGRGKRGGRGGGRGAGANKTNTTTERNDKKKNSKNNNYDELDSDNEDNKGKYTNNVISHNQSTTVVNNNNNFQNPSNISRSPLINNNNNLNQSNQNRTYSNNNNREINNNFINANPNLNSKLNNIESTNFNSNRNFNSNQNNNRVNNNINFPNTNNTNFQNNTNNNFAGNNNNIQSNNFTNNNFQKNIFPKNNNGQNNYAQNNYAQNNNVSNPFLSKGKFDQNQSSLAKCPKCSKPMRLNKNKSNQAFFMGCSGYPDCKQTQSINNPLGCVISDKQCNKCSNRDKVYLHELTDNEGNTELVCLADCILKSGNNYNSNTNFSNNSNNNNSSNNNISNNYDYKRKKENSYEDNDIKPVKKNNKNNAFKAVNKDKGNKKNNSNMNNSNNEEEYDYGNNDFNDFLN